MAEREKRTCKTLLHLFFLLFKYIQTTTWNIELLLYLDSRFSKKKIKLNSYISYLFVTWIQQNILRDLNETSFTVAVTAACYLYAFSLLLSYHIHTFDFEWLKNFYIVIEIILILSATRIFFFSQTFFYSTNYFFYPSKKDFFNIKKSTFFLIFIDRIRRAFIKKKRYLYHYHRSRFQDKIDKLGRRRKSLYTPFYRQNSYSVVSEEKNENL